MGRKRLEGRVAIVTGGTIGIGRAICLALAGEGAHVVVVGRNTGRLAETAAAMEGAEKKNAHAALCLDVTNEADMERMAETAIERFGRIDILIAAAGILRAKGGRLRTLQQMSPQEWDEVLDTNLKGVFLSNRAVLPSMIKRRSGNIVNISSTSGRKGLAYDSAYCASKFGVVGLSEALAEEMRQYGIRVQTLLPGAIGTGMWNQNGPLPRPGTILSADRVADIVVHMIALPDGTLFPMPIIEPFKMHLNTGWIGRSIPEDGI